MVVLLELYMITAFLLYFIVTLTLFEGHSSNNNKHLTLKVVFLCTFLCDEVQNVYG